MMGELFWFTIYPKSSHTDLWQWVILTFRKNVFCEVDNWTNYHQYCLIIVVVFILKLILNDWVPPALYLMLY